MIFFFNGAHKNASHFQLLIVTESMKQQGIPFEIVGDLIFDETRLFQSGPEAGKKILDAVYGREDQVYVCKAHWGSAEERDALLTYGNIKIFLIWRDLRDVLVSSYFYRMKKYQNPYRDFAHYYWQEGRTQAFHQMVYRRVWNSVKDRRVYQTNFTDLKQNFSEATLKLLRFAEIKKVDLDELEERLSIQRLREAHNDPSGFLFRKGKIGEYKEAIRSDVIIEDIGHIEKMSLTALKLNVFRHDPKLILKRHYGFPAQNTILRLARGSHKLRQYLRQAR